MILPQTGNNIHSVHMLFYDFFLFYAAGKLLHQGGDPYDIQQLDAMLLVVGYPADKQIMPFPYPPWTLWLFYLLSFFSFHISLTFLFAANLLGGLFIAFWSWRTFSAPPWFRRYKIVPLWLSFVPFLKELFFGQLTVLPYASIVAGLNLLRTNRTVLAGAIISFSLIKPHLWFGLYGFLSARALYRRQFGLVLGGLLGLSAQIIAGWFIHPYDLGFWSTRLTSLPHGNSEVRIVSTSLLDIFSHALHIPMFKFTGLFVAAVIGFSRAKNCPDEDMNKVVCTSILPISLLLAPYAWAHDYIVLFPLLVERLLLLARGKSEAYFLRSWAATAAILAGLLFFECGNPLSPAPHAPPTHALEVTGNETYSS